jgi:hypothetical protein
MSINRGRVWLGGLAGGVVWSIWSFFVGTRQTALLAAAQEHGYFLKEPRYPFFVGEWLLILFIMSIILAHLYAWSRATAGPGPYTALKIGAMVGLCAGLPGNFAQAAWSPVPRALPLGWMSDLWGGAILATLVAGWLYRE